MLFLLCLTMYYLIYAENFDKVRHIIGERNRQLKVSWEMLINLTVLTKNKYNRGAKAHISDNYSSLQSVGENA